MILVILFFLLSCIFPIVKFNKRVEVVLPSVVFTIVLILNLSYCVNLLKIGYYFVFAAFFILWILLFAFVFKNGVKNTSKIFATNFFTPALFIFLIAVVVAYFITRNNIVTLWDELRLWGAYPKILYYTETTQLKDNAILFSSMKSYFPGMPLFIYFIEKLSGSFSEAKIFFGYAVFGISLFLPCLNKLRWKKDFIKIIPITIIVLVAPLVFYNSLNDCGNYYMSLFIDPIIGLMIAYIFFLAAKGISKDYFSAYAFIVANAIIVILKDSGIMFAIISAIIVLVVDYKTIKEELKKTVSRIKYICAFIIPIIIFLQWKMLLIYYGVGASIKFDLKLDFQLDFLVTFIKNLLFTGVMLSNFDVLNKYLTFGSLFILLTLSFIIIIKLIDKEKRKNYIKTAFGLLVSMTLFIIGFYITCISGFSNNIFSYPRYISTILLAAFIFLIFCFLYHIDEIIERLKKDKKINIVLFFMIAIFLIISPLRKAIVYPNECYKFDLIAEKIKNKFDNNNYNDKELVQIYLAQNEIGELDFSLTHHGIYFDLIGTNLNIKNYFTDTQINEDYKDVEFLERLKKEGYDYMYIETTDELISLK